MVLRATLSVAALAALAACSGTEAPAQRVILITCDTLRADRLGAYGYERDVTPNLDAFARDCVVFDSAYATAPMTQPAIASLLTGRYAQEVGATPGNIRLVHPQIETLPEYLASQGVATAAVVSNYILRKDPRFGDAGRCLLPKARRGRVR